MSRDPLVEIEQRYRAKRLSALGLASIIRRACDTFEASERLRKRWSARKAVIDQEAGR